MRRENERLGGLVERRAGIASIGILRKRRVGEVKKVNIEMHRERSGREVAKCTSDRLRRSGDKGLAGRHLQGEPRCLLSLPLRCYVGFDPHPCHLVRFEKWSWSKGVDEHIHAPGK